MILPWPAAAEPRASSNFKAEPTSLAPGLGCVTRRDSCTLPRVSREVTWSLPLPRSRDHVARSQCMVKHPLGTRAGGWWPLQISLFSPFSIFFTFCIPDTETILVSADKRGPRPPVRMTIVLVCWCAIFTDLPLEQVTSAQLAGESGHCAAALIGARCWAMVPWCRQ